MFGEDERGNANKRYTIESYVNARSIPRPDTLAKLCKVLGVEKDDLLPSSYRVGTPAPLVSYEQIDRNTVRLGIHPQEMPVRKALRIMAILNEENDEC